MLLHVGARTAGIPIHEDLNFNFFPCEDAPDTPKTRTFSAVHISPGLMFCTSPNNKVRVLLDIKTNPHDHYTYLRECVLACFS